MRNQILKRRLEYTMLSGIIINALSFFLPIISVTLTSETKQYTESYSVGSLIKLLVPSVLNGGKGALSNPPLALMAVMLLGMICWIASIFTIILVMQSRKERKVDLFRTIAVSVFELLSGIFFLVLASQAKTFAIRIAVEPFIGNLRSGFSFMGLLPALATVVFAFINIFLLLSILRSGEDYGEAPEEDDTKQSRPMPARDRAAANVSGEYARRRQPQREMPTDAFAPSRTPVRTDVYSGAAEPRQTAGAYRAPTDAQRAARPMSYTGAIDKDHLPRQNAYGAPGRPNQPNAYGAPSRPAQPSAYGAPGRTQQPSASAPQPTVACVKCGAMCRRGSRFCSICGEVLPRPLPRCRSCGEVISEKDVFCPTCGANIR